MGTRLEEVVLAGPNQDGEWFWRPVEGGETRPVPEALVEPDWKRGGIVKLLVTRSGSTIELVGPPEPEPDALLYVDGEPYVPPDTLELEPGSAGHAIVLDAPSHHHLAYRPGVPLIRAVVGAPLPEQP
jgi:hypothetical protein